MLLDDVFAVTYYTIKKLYLNNNRLKVFSADYRFQSMFEGIRLDNNNLTEFPTAIYFNVKYADELNFGGNPISALGPYLFSITNRIFYLGFSNCLINSIGSDSFTKLHTLITLDLSQNRIASLNNEYFPELSSLKVLNLSHNEIYFVSKDVFQSLNCLTNLDLLNNRIMEIEDMAFLNLNSLKIMGLDENPLVDLFKNYTFTGLNQIKFMDISNTVIFNIEIVKSIISQIKLRLLRVVLDNIKFYDSIEIALPLNLTEPYSKDFCFYISYLSRNLITLNLKNDDYVEKFVADCRDWSTDFYQATLVDYN
jgi:Leucine-rich repeat (LRR) protein